MGTDSFTIFEDSGQCWDGRLGGVLDPDQGQSWNYPSPKIQIWDESFRMAPAIIGWYLQVAVPTLEYVETTNFHCIIKLR